MPTKSHPVDSTDGPPRFSAARNGDGNGLEILGVVGDVVGVYTRAGNTDGVNK
jgi:hypothetical protein